MAKEKVRTFESGAFRDTDGDKLQFSRSLSPIVLIRYTEFISKHNSTKAGKRREDNWKKGFPREAYMESKFRHFMETWLIQDGLKDYPDLDPKCIEDIALEELIESLCAELFNTQGFLHVLLLEQRERTKNRLPKKKYPKPLIEKQLENTKESPVHYRPIGNKSLCGLKSTGTSIWSWTHNRSEVTCKTCKKIIKNWNK